MSQIEEIPCAACKLWNAETKSFSCDPNRCGRLSEWLLGRVPQLNANNAKVSEQAQVPIQYVV